MKTITINCDICGSEMNTEGYKLKFEGYVTDSINGLLFDAVEHCCESCRTTIVRKLRDTYINEVNRIKYLKNITTEKGE